MIDVVWRWAIPYSPWLVTADDGRSGAQWGHGLDVQASDFKDADVVCVRVIEKCDRIVFGARFCVVPCTSSGAIGRRSESS
jgi:hypothetical protein